MKVGRIHWSDSSQTVQPLHGNFEVLGSQINTSHVVRYQSVTDSLKIEFYPLVLLGVAGGTKLLYCLAFLLQFIILHCTVVKYFEPHHRGVDRLA